MPQTLRNLTERGVYDAEALATLERIYLAVCDMLDIGHDDLDGRHIIAKAVLFAFDRGTRDIDQLKAAAIIASKTPLLERGRERPAA